MKQIVRNCPEILLFTMFYIIGPLQENSLNNENLA